MAIQLASSSSLPPSWTYDVFLSFRGEDTRFTFTDHLYKALHSNGIDTFIDRHLIRGEEISPAFLKAIEESKISIIVISENYVSSRWCLNELVHILECRRSRQQIVWLVFYKVDPSHVRNQTSSFASAFTGLKCKYKDEEKILLWRSALKEVANLSGHTVKEGEYEATFIDKIVMEILVKVLQRTYLNVAKYPVGIQSCVQKVKGLLGVGGNDPFVVGIWGTSGIGKTTIAKAIYNAIAHKFEVSCFLADVSERSASREGVIQLQKTLLSKVQCGKKLKIDDAYQGISLIKKLLRRKKILLILDDVDELEQLNNLVEVDWFAKGSRVIITTKDRGLLESYGVGLIHEVEKLKDGKALELFSLNAFRRNEPPDNYLELAQRAIAYAEGLPLALNLIGSHLRNKSIDRWQAILDNYDSYDGEPYRGIQNILRKSYDTLDNVLQQVFLDIACFFKGEKKGYMLQILRSSKLHVPSDCIEVLVEKAIITIEDNTILMHDLLEKMGKRIVSEESPIEPGKRSRLWHHEDVYRVLTENRGTKKIKGIVVKWPKPDLIPLNSKSFFKMVNLEIFISRNALFSGCVDYMPNYLRWIDLGGDKFRIWGSNILQKHTVTFNLQYLPRHLVTYNMSYSDIRKLKGFKNLANLTYMNLRGCKFLEKIPDLSGSPNIEFLDLHGCTNLVEVDDSIGFLDKLVTLNLKGCSRLTRFAPKLRLRSLKSLYLHGCTRLESFPEIEDEMESLTYLDIQKSGIRELPSSIAYLTGLAELLANECESLVGTSLHHLYGLPHLIQVSFGQCPKLMTFGKNKMKFDEVSSSSTKSQLLSNDLKTSQDNYNTFALPNLHSLHLEGCNLSESNFLLPLDCWSTLTHLDLSRNNFVSLPDCISKFVHLETLCLNGCKRLRETPQALPPKLIELYLDDCTSLGKISKLPPELQVLHLLNCFRLCGHGVAKLENNLLNEGFFRRSILDVIYPGNEVPKLFNCTSSHRTTFQHLRVGWGRRDFIGGSSFKIPLNLQAGETLLGLILSVVLEPPNNSNFDNYYVIINGTEGSTHNGWPYANLEAAHVGLKLVDLEKKQGDICNVEFLFYKGARIRSCGVHPLLRKQDEWLPMSLGPTSSLGKRPRPLGSSDTVHEEYDRQRQWLSLSSNPADDHPKRRQIDRNVPFDIEEEQEQPSTSDDSQSTSDDSQFFLH
ncbi:TMV resistance protein N-like [Malus domestica]|uniref:TMV resistance protein N-like n=1 Tax=Malus domestica TaxID=3750 RepID=UPI0039759C78